MIRVGIGGWTYEPWRNGVFYPKGHPKARELSYAAQKLTAIEVNGTYYSTFRPPTFRKWADETPEDFVFALKANRFATNRRVLAEAGSSIDRFITSGIEELQKKLGPILWQFMPTKKFDPEDMEAFLALLPKSVGGLELNHALEVRHESFCCEAFVALMRKYRAAIVLADSPKYPMISDISGDFLYARLMDADAKVETGYKTAAIKHWVESFKLLEKGAQPKDLTLLAKPAPKKRRDAFVFVINGAKERAPAGAMAMIAALK